MSEFSLPCESNSSMAIYANNTALKFTVNMRGLLELNDEWKLPLASYNIPALGITCEFGVISF